MSIISKLSKVKEIPVLPEVIFKVQSLVNSDDSGATELSAVIEQDPALSSTILKSANSAYYNVGRRQIISIREAITRIGFNEVYKITIAMSIIKQFMNTNAHIGYKAFWRHSMVGAGLATVIADSVPNKLDSKIKEHVYMSGLLHDIGILIIDQFFHDDFDAVFEYAAKNETTFLTAEQTVNSYSNHSLVGGALLELWKLAPPVINSVRFHHNPEKTPESYRQLVAVISLTEYVLCNGFSGSFEGKIDKLDKSVWEILGLPVDDSESIYHFFAKAESEAEKADIVLSNGVAPITSSCVKTKTFGLSPLRTI